MNDDLNYYSMFVRGAMQGETLTGDKSEILHCSRIPHISIVYEEIIRATEYTLRIAIKNPEKYLVQGQHTLNILHEANKKNIAVKMLTFDYNEVKGDAVLNNFAYKGIQDNEYVECKNISDTWGLYMDFIVISDSKRYLFVTDNKKNTSQWCGDATKYKNFQGNIEYLDKYFDSI